MSPRVFAIFILATATSCSNADNTVPLYYEHMQSSYVDSVSTSRGLVFQTVDLGAMSDTFEVKAGNEMVLNYLHTLNLDTLGLMGMVNSCSFITDSTMVLGMSTGEVAIVDHRNLRVLKSFSNGKGPGEFKNPQFVSANDGVVLVNDVGLMRSTLIDATDFKLLKFLPTRAAPFSITISDGKITYMDAKELEKGFMLVREDIHDSSRTDGERFRMGLAFENLDWTHNRTYNVSAIGDWYLIYSSSIPHIMVYDHELHLRHIVSLKHDEILKGFTDPLPDHIKVDPPGASWKKRVFHGVFADGSRALINTVYGFVLLDFSKWTVGAEVPWSYIPKINPETAFEGSEAHIGLEIYIPYHVSMDGSYFMACPAQQDFIDFFEVSERR